MAASAQDPGAEPVIRAATERDGATMWRLVRDCGVLELNTPYAYMVLCRDFGHTSVIAEIGGQPTGFVLGYRPPREPEVVFVWQIGVAPAGRGRGLGGKLLDALCQLPGCAGVRFLETTVTPSNEASLNLFTSFARDQSAPIERVGGFASEDFPQQPHEREDRYRIGPLPPNEAPKT